MREVNLITFYGKRTEHRELTRKLNELEHKRLSMPTVFNFNQAAVTNTSEFNLAGELDLKKPIQVLLR